MALSGVLIGFAISTKYNALLDLIVLPCAFLLYPDFDTSRLILHPCSSEPCRKT